MPDGEPTNLYDMRLQRDQLAARVAELELAASHQAIEDHGPNGVWTRMHAATAEAVRVDSALNRLQERLSTCKFCGQSIAEGAGGHTSSCYETMLNKAKAELAASEARGLGLERDHAEALEEARACRMATRGTEADRDHWKTCARALEAERDEGLEELKRLTRSNVALRVDGFSERPTKEALQMWLDGLRLATRCVLSSHDVAALLALVDAK